MRLDKFVADGAGFTRSEARKIIKAGKVSVDGSVVKDISFAVDVSTLILVNGKKISYRKYIYIMMNKPAGIISATEDKHKKTVLDLLGENYRRFDLFPVGRLDIDTEGFLLLTNDGETAHKLLSPSKNCGKTYFVRLKLDISDEDISILENGVDIGECITKRAKIERVSENEIKLTITEGKFHQIKRMAEKVSNKVVYLKRLAYGELFLDNSLIPGGYRELTEAEISLLVRLSDD